MRDYAKDRIKGLKLDRKGKVRINMAGCLDRCNEGPVIVVYPEEVWYTYVDKEDIDEIIEEHATHIDFFNDTASGTATVIHHNRERLAFLTSAHIVHFPDTLVFYFDS